MDLKKCVFCGAKLDERLNHCAYCGTVQATNEPVRGEEVVTPIERFEGFHPVNNRRPVKKGELTTLRNWLMIGAYPVGMFVLSSVISMVVMVARGYNLDHFLGEGQIGVLAVTNFWTFVILCGILVVMAAPAFKADFKKVKNWGNFTIQMILGLICTFTAAFIGNSLVVMLGTTDQAANQELVEALLMNMPWMMILVVGILGPIVEEIVFRLALMKVFKVPPVVNILISSFVFGAIHVLAGGFIHIIPYFLMGLVFAIIYMKNDNIWHATILHILHNSATIGLIFLVQAMLPYME